MSDFASLVRCRFCFNLIAAVALFALASCDGGTVTVLTGDSAGTGGDTDITGGDQLGGGDDAPGGDAIPGSTCEDLAHNGNETGVDCGGADCDPCAAGQGCSSADDCLSSVCNTTCQAADCFDLAVNQDETDVDCGGLTCGSCADGLACDFDTDCQSDVCDFGFCTAPACDDRAQNGGETDLNCGGAECLACADGAGCESPDDCDSRVCALATDTCQSATCSDGVISQGEEGIDCGGPCVSEGKLCPTGNGCTDDADCATGICDAGACREDTCRNSSQDAGEEGIDCGGPQCAPCPDGGGCAVASDCASGVCNIAVQTCTVAACDDGVRNGTEIDVDCGGSCAACDDGSECTADSQCGSGTCRAGLCIPATCVDAANNGDETGIDCGGSCPACPVASDCSVGSDCESGVCDAGSGTCSDATCTDSVHNGDETDSDCGGSCDPCPTGGGCSDGYDCVGGACSSAGVCTDPSCVDGVQNGDETGRDCGGPCAPCDSGRECEAAADCASGVCTDFVCAEATCTDGIQNADETGPDCGGICATLIPVQTCADGLDCVLNSDCTNDQCSSGTCVADHCFTGGQDFDETDVNCGGADCAACAVGAGCLSGSDCATGSCDPQNSCAGSGCTCQAPACDDGLQNGDETGIDCGGTCAGLGTPLLCATGTGCSAGADCSSGVCLGDRCQAPACDDGVQNGDETGSDCGGTCVSLSTPLACAVGDGCMDGDDCMSASCDPGNVCAGSDCICQAPACDDGVQNGTETGLDCGGSCSAGCADGQACGDGSDCTSGSCGPQNICAGPGCTCQAPACDDGVQNGDETGLDCGGACADLATAQTCALGEGCLDGADCTTTFCDGGTGTCIAGHCNDSLQNFDETDLNCGGADCAACAVDQGCDLGTDCLTGSCGAQNQCPSGGCTCQAPACDDGVENGDEVDVDCGNATVSGCAACTAGQGCVAATDCASGVCDTNICQAARCGDGVQNGSEDCDDGNSFNTDACLNNCLGASCGDGFVQGSVEDCDGDGAGAPGQTSSCDVDCSTALCGDGTVNGAAGETCDDDNDVTTDACPSGPSGSCQTAVCGDGFVQAGQDDCDGDGAGNGGETISCNVDCTVASCGDGVTNDAAGETCDDNNDVTTDACPSGPTGTCQSANCGDEYVWSGNEECDDGASNSDSQIDACRTDCMDAGCGDSVVDSGEFCDTSVGTDTCVSHQYAGGTLQCADDCLAFDFSACADGCGNNRIDAGEPCDGTALAGSTCGSFDFTGGTLGCTDDCTDFDLSGCSGGCGDGVKDGSDQCDGNDGVPLDCSTVDAGSSGTISDCNLDCTLDLSTCADACGNGTRDGGEDCDPAESFSETCADVVTGGVGAVSCASDCTWDVSACTACGDGTRDPGEACDPGDGSGIGPDLGGQTCILQGASAGSLGCLSDCSDFDLSACTSCGNDQIDPGEFCDGLDLGVTGGGEDKTCLNIGGGYEGGELRCNDTCSGLDEGGCNNCEAGCPGYCDASTNGICECPLFEEVCGNACINLKVDPNNCGDCGIVCTGAQVCSAGQCIEDCLTPLVKDGTGRCVNPRTSDQYCGDQQEDCTAAGEFCIDGGCSNGSGSGGGNHLDHTSSLTDPNPTFCANGGPIIDLNLGTGDDPVDPTQSCSGNLAASNFRWGMCSCNDISLNQDILVDGYDSFSGPYMPLCEDRSTACTVDTVDTDCAMMDLDGDGLLSCTGDIGAGLGSNGLFSNNQTSWVWGALWWEDPRDPNIGTATVRQNLYAGQNLPGGNIFVHCDTAGGEVCDVTLEGDVGASGFTNGDLHANPGASVSGSFQVDGQLLCGEGDVVVTDYATCTETPLAVREPCDCAREQRIPVVELVDGHACDPQGTSGCSGLDCCTGSNNNNTDIGLDPTIFETVGGMLRLPCGQYSLTNIDGGNDPVNIVIDGRTVIYIDGEIDVVNLTITMTDNAELDVFIKGAICAADFVFGSPNFPARARIYVAGGDLCSGYVNDQTACEANHCLYDVGSGACTSDATGASACTGQAEERALSLQNTQAAGNIYAPWGTLAQPQTLLMYGGLFLGGYDISQPTTIHFDTGVTQAGGQCPTDCGNGEIDDIEQCDPGDPSQGIPPTFAGQTCQTLGFDGGTITCDAAGSDTECELNTAGCFWCGDGVVNGSESCEPTVPHGETCNSLGLGNGPVTCQADCTFNTSQCGVCGNDIIEAGEDCDETNLGGATCVSLGFDGGTLGCVTAGSGGECTFDVSGCFLCGDGAIDMGEGCDPGDPSGTPPENLGGLGCSDYGFDSGSLSCRNNCTVDTSGCYACGNFLLEPGEECDGSALGGETCQSQTDPVTGGPYDGGSLSCDDSCQLDDAGCFVCGDGVIEGTEACEPGDTNGETCESQGFPLGGVINCDADSCQLDTSGCNLANCGDFILQLGEDCDLGASGGPLGAPLDCSSIDPQYSGGTVTACLGSCAYDLSDCTICGDGIIDPGEDCDGTNLGGNECIDVGTGFSGGNLACNLNCTFNVDACTECGNGVIELGEACDPNGPQLGGEDCASQGYDGGTLSCDASCNIDPAGCFWCGDGTVDSPDEDCEPGDSADCSILGGVGSLSCTNACIWDTSACVLCGDGVIEGSEQCEGNDFAGESCTSRGFDGGSLSCVDCAIDDGGCFDCGDGTLDSGEACDPGSPSDPGDDLFASDCVSMGFDGGDLTCNLDCSVDPAGCFECGDGVRNTGEQCDGDALGGQSCVGLGGGFSGGTLACFPKDHANECTFDDSGCFECGDGTINPPGEQCEGNDFDGESCVSQGFDSGDLACVNCQIDTSGCVRAGCGNGTTEGTEVCDKGPSGGALGSPVDCSSLTVDPPWTGGVITDCGADCSLDDSPCYRCGDGVINGTEQCDLPDLGGATCQSEGYGGGGTIGCTASCMLDTSGCIECTDACEDCGPGIACRPDNVCGPCTSSADCCAPLQCFAGQCVLF